MVGKSHDKILDRININAVIELLKEYFANDRQGLIEMLYCVVMTKKAMNGGDDDAEKIYRTMRGISPSLPESGAEFFFNIYTALASMDDRDILYYIDISDKGRELFVPNALAREFASHITESVRSVLVPECERYGYILPDIIGSHPDISFTLTCGQKHKFELLKIVYGHFENVKILFADIYDYGFSSEKYDLIIAVPAFGGRTLVNNDEFICREPDMIALQNLLYHINMDGELVIALPAKITFGGGNLSSLREYVADNYKIKEIGVLPPGLFLPYTTIRTCLFVFSSGSTDDVVLKRYESPDPATEAEADEKLIVKNKLLLLGDEFAALNGWNIDTAFSGDEDFKAFEASSVKKLRLRDVASVFRGKAVNKQAKEGNIGVINISDITEVGIDYSDLVSMDEEERKVLRYVLKDGDVLVTARGTTLKVAVFEAQPYVCIPSVNINVIRPKEMLKGAYLKLFLESPVGVKMLRGLRRGSGVVNINCRDIAELEIPVPPLDLQESLINEYDAGLKLYKDTIDAAEKSWNRIQSEIYSKLF